MMLRPSHLALTMLLLPACTPEIASDQEGPQLTLEAERSESAFAIQLCLRDAGFDAHRPADAWAHMNASGAGTWRVEGRNVDFGQGATLDSSASKELDRSIGLSVDGPWHADADFRCMDAQRVRFRLQDASADARVSVDWSVILVVEQPRGPDAEQRYDEQDIEIRIEEMDPLPLPQD